MDLKKGEDLAFSPGMKPLKISIVVTIGMNYTVLEGKEDLFERAFRSVLDVMGKMPGHTKSNLYRDVEEPRTYLILSEWNDKAAFDAFVKSEAFAKVTNWGKEQVLAKRPSHHIYSPEK